MWDSLRSLALPPTAGINRGTESDRFRNGGGSLPRRGQIEGVDQPKRELTRRTNVPTDRCIAATDWGDEERDTHESRRPSSRGINQNPWKERRVATTDSCACVIQEERGSTAAGTGGRTRFVKADASRDVTGRGPIDGELNPGVEDRDYFGLQKEAEKRPDELSDKRDLRLLAKSKLWSKTLAKGGGRDVHIRGNRYVWG